MLQKLMTQVRKKKKVGVHDNEAQERNTTLLIVLTKGVTLIGEFIRDTHASLLLLYEQYSI